MFDPLRSFHRLAPFLFAAAALKMLFCFIRDKGGHAHASVKLFFDFMVKLAAFRCYEHPLETLSEKITLDSIGLQCEDPQPGLTSRWGSTWQQILSQCRLCFNLPRTELYKPGSYTNRQEYLADRPYQHRCKWAVRLAMCSDSLFSVLEKQTARRFVDVAVDHRRAGKKVFNESFQFSAVQERSLEGGCYLKSVEGTTKGKSKEDLGREFAGVHGIGHFAAGHALLLLSGGGSVKTLGSLGVKDSRGVFAGSGCVFVAKLLLSHKSGWVLSTLAEEDVEKVIVESRRGLAAAAERLLKQGVIEKIPFCVRRADNGKFLAINETIADLFSETRQLLNFMLGRGKFRKSLENAARHGMAGHKAAKKVATTMVRRRIFKKQTPRA